MWVGMGGRICYGLYMQTQNVNVAITVTGRHVEITEAMRDHAHKKVEGLHLDYPKIIEAKVILDVQSHKNRHIAEIILFCANHITIEAHTETHDMYASIDETISKIARRMRKHKTRLLRKHRPRKNESIRHLPESVFSPEALDALGETEEPELSRMTFVVMGDDRVLEQIRKQLEKIVTVVKVVDVSSQDYVERDLMLMKVKAPAGKRSEIRELVDIFRGRIVDVGADEVMIEMSGRESKIEAFINSMRPFGITELVRTGRIAMVRSDAKRLTDATQRKAS